MLTSGSRFTKARTLLQWGSEIRTSLDFEWFIRDLVANGSLEIWLQMVWILNGLGYEQGIDEQSSDK